MAKRAGIVSGTVGMLVLTASAYATAHPIPPDQYRLAATRTGTASRQGFQEAFSQGMQIPLKWQLREY